MTMRNGTVVVVALALILALCGIPAFAQDKPADNMQLVRDKIKADKKLFVGEAMQLTDSEQKGFWPVYDDYQKDWMKLNDRSANLIKQYADNYKSMTNDVAKRLTDDFMAIRSDQQKLREAYLPKCRRVLPEMKVARYYQLENKIEAVVDYELAMNIPLVK